MSSSVIQVTLFKSKTTPNMLHCRYGQFLHHLRRLHQSRGLSEVKWPPWSEQLPPNTSCVQYLWLWWVCYPKKEPIWLPQSWFRSLNHQSSPCWKEEKLLLISWKIWINPYHSAKPGEKGHSEGDASEISKKAERQWNNWTSSEAWHLKSKVSKLEIKQASDINDTAGEKCDQFIRQLSQVPFL